MPSSINRLVGRLIGGETGDIPEFTLFGTRTGVAAVAAVIAAGQAAFASLVGLVADGEVIVAGQSSAAITAMSTAQADGFRLVSAQASLSGQAAIVAAADEGGALVMQFQGGDNITFQDGAFLEFQAA